MTRPKISRFPVSSFGPELMSILLKGARERVELPCPDQRTMKYLQMRLQMLRGAMSREKHPNYTLVTRARTSRTWDTKLGKDQKCVLIVQPNDSQFSDILRKAGVTIEPAAQDLLDEGVETLPPKAAAEPTHLGPEADLVPPADPYARFKGL